MALQASFAGRRVLVTGGANGLGRKLVERLAADKAHVYALDKSAPDLERLKKEVPGNVQTLVADLGNWDQTQTVLDSIGHVDHLVNNAGFMKLGPFLKIGPADFETAMNVNLRSMIQVSQAVIRRMIEQKSGGSIVNLSSIAISAAAKNYVLYGATKAGVLNITRNLAVEFAQHKIRVNCICPGPMDTALIDDAREMYCNPDKGYLKQRGLIRRLLTTHEASDLVLFLLSPLSSYITGEHVFIDGGLTIT